MSFHGHKPSITLKTCSCTVSGLEQTIRERFRRGEPIGITFFGEESAGIFIGRYRGVDKAVLEIDDLLLPETTSFVPLNEVGSVEKGVEFQEQPLSLKLNN